MYCYVFLSVKKHKSKNKKDRYLSQKGRTDRLVVSSITLFFPMFFFDPPENIRKPKVF